MQTQMVALFYNRFAGAPDYLGGIVCPTSEAIGYTAHATESIGYADQTSETIGHVQTTSEAIDKC